MSKWKTIRLLPDTKKKLDESMNFTQTHDEFINKLLESYTKKGKK